MWIFVLVCALGLNTHQATGQGNSTQIYYAKLTIERSAFENLTDRLQQNLPLSKVNNHTVEVVNLTYTTRCQSLQNHTECNCTETYRWSDEVCDLTPKCCDNKTCEFPPKSPAVCVSDKRVTVSGSITLPVSGYKNCLQINTAGNKDCNENLYKKMREVFSTLMGFESLRIIRYRLGSVIADFTMTSAYAVTPEDLIDRSEILSKNLPASLFLQTSGVVQLTMPPNPVDYNDSHEVICTVAQGLDSRPLLSLTRSDKEFHITNGTQSEVMEEWPKTTVTLKEITELWAGEYTCTQNQHRNSITISHKARGVMDVCLLPNIEIRMSPSFLNCQNNETIVESVVRCEVLQSSENYTVTWNSNQQSTSKSSSNGRDVYKYKTYILCASAKSKSFTCTFVNRCNQTRNASVSLREFIISESDKYCDKTGDWEVTKANFTAELDCKNMVGKRQRTCRNNSAGAVWEKEVPDCVNLDVHNVLQQAQIVDIGLGSADSNSARVFSLLQNATKNPQDINTYPNVKASVDVLTILSNKTLHPNGTATSNFLESSSNLLNQTLQDVWQTKDPQGNASTPNLASVYLKSVEDLIMKSDVTHESEKNNLDVSSKSCTAGSECFSKVFNISVVLKAQNPGNVKTAAFKELANYLPNKDDKMIPNSLVVSATMKNNTKSSVKVTITFNLQEARRRNVMLHCVYWDVKNNIWSKEGCTWTGPSNEGQCTCYHLSSFALLMSRNPEDVPGTKVITYVGLSVSVASLVIALVIELIVWSAVVKTNASFLRHIAHINISLCLLVADCCFLASFEPKNLSVIWCKTLTVVKHFCFLAMFFWMLCLSSTLLHQALFLFHTVSKKSYLTYSLVIGYACPLLIVSVTVIAYKEGDKDHYFTKDTCWLVHAGFLKGSFYTFLLPVVIIILFNVFSMVVVIMKLLDHPKDADVSYCKEKRALITAIRSVVLLTPVFGVTWTLGLAVFMLDLTMGKPAYVINYAFNLLNTFQGLFILLTTCLGEKMTRDALLDRLRTRAPASSTKETSTTDSNWK